jgi:hypothetical protein
MTGNTVSQSVKARTPKSCPNCGNKPTWVLMGTGGLPVLTANKCPQCYVWNKPTVVQRKAMRQYLRRNVARPVRNGEWMAFRYAGGNIARFA